MSTVQQIKEKFKNLYQTDPLMVQSPGRVNLIGEHTDYNMGLVLPAAIDKKITLAIGKRDDQQISLYSVDNDEHYQGNLEHLRPTDKLWPDYLLGVVEQLIKRGYLLSGFNIVFGGDIPQGAGLSSSAALECATAYGLSQLFGFAVPPLTIALMAQAAENEFVGVKCGLMDQFASVFGKEKHLIKLDCRDYTYEYIPFTSEDIKIVLFDTRVKHSLASSAYNERREQCERGVSLVKATYPAVESLRDVSEEQLLALVKPVDEVVYRRCHYVVTEIQRLLDACEDLKRDDFESFGKRMFETHEGLQQGYEVSCDELDLLVDLVRPLPAVLGARMMGGGFGGCTINLVRSAQIEEVTERVAEAYKINTGHRPEIYLANISKGSSRLIN